MEKDEKQLAQVVSDMDRLAFKGGVQCGGCAPLQKQSIKHEAQALLCGFLCSLSSCLYGIITQEIQF